MLVFIYTHTEAGSGDLFYAHQLSSCDVQQARTAITQGRSYTLTSLQWWNEVMPDKLVTAGGKHEVSVALLCCGALLTTPAKFDVFKACCRRYVGVRFFRATTDRGANHD